MQATKHSRKHIQALLSCTNKEEYIHNVYKLLSIEQTVRYLHAAAGVRKYFLESEEIQLGHI
jgi:hypothetical protein